MKQRLTFEQFFTIRQFWTVKINLTRINFYSFFFFSNETTYSSSSAVKPIPEFLKNEETTFDLSFRLLSRLKLDSLRHVKNSRKRNT